MDFTQLLNSDLSNQIISGISQKTGASEQETQSVIREGFPILLGMIQNNAIQQNDSAGLLKALKKHDGGILDNISSFLGDADTTDGNKILGHILGKNQSTIEKTLSEKTGVEPSLIKKILPLLAPIILGYLGKQTQGKGQIDIGGILGNLLGGNSKSTGDLLSSILGNDSLKSIGDSKKGKKKSGLDGLLGSFFGKK